MKITNLYSHLNYYQFHPIINQKRLETSSSPVLVKKQEKYNIYRWALTGIDDYSINLKCYKIYEYFKKSFCNKSGKIYYLYSVLT